MGHRLDEKCSARCNRQENWVPEEPTCASFALARQSNLNSDSKLFSLYKVQLHIIFCENCVIILHMFMQLIFFKYDRFFSMKNKIFVSLLPFTLLWFFLINYSS
jgi:hypothetical protein